MKEDEFIERRQTILSGLRYNHKPLYQYLMSNIYHIIPIVFIVSGFLAGIAILFLIFPHRRQSMKIMEVVWPLTGLWANWLGLWAYFRLNSKKAGNMEESMDMGNMDMKSMENMDMPQRPLWQTVALSTLHCGAGCTLADIVGEWTTFWVPISIGGSFVAGQWVLDYALALMTGVFFQYAAIRPMEYLSRRQTIIKAFKIDFFSLTAWQIGMYGWMSVVIFGIYHNTPLPKNSWEFWFMMQIAMFAGFLTSYPANWLLIKLGIKKGM